MSQLRHPLSLARSWFWYTPLYAAATAGFGLVSMALSPFDPSGRKQHAVARAWARTLLRIAGIRVRVTGLEHLPRDAPAVLVCNHLSYMDVPVLFAVLPLHFRILAKQGLFRIPFLGGHLRRSQHLPVDQSNPRTAMQSLYKAAAQVAAGLPVFVFPEAGRSFDGVLHEFVPGAFFLALQAQVPVVPLVLAGTYEVLRPATSHLRPGQVRLTICAPIATTGRNRRDAAALAAQVRDEMAPLYAAAHADLAAGDGEAGF